MARVVLKAAKLETKEGDRFFALFDCSGLVKDELTANQFLTELRRIYPSQMTLAYRCQNEWSICGGDRFVEHQKTLKLDPLTHKVRDLTLEIPDIFVSSAPESPTAPANT